MKSDDIEARMRQGEYFHGPRALPGAYIVLRVDGRSFSRLTERICEEPFDAGFHRKMAEAAKALVTSLQGSYAHVQSDEISVLLPHGTALFDREVEKLVSIAASAATATLSLSLGEPVELDARLWLGARRGNVVDYFRWRQSDATRCALRAQQLVLLDAPARGQERPGGHARARRPVGRAEERAPVLARHRLQRGAGVAAPRLGRLLEERLQDREEPEDGRERHHHAAMS